MGLMADNNPLSPLATPPPAAFAEQSASSPPPPLEVILPASGEDSASPAAAGSGSGSGSGALSLKSLKSPSSSPPAQRPAHGGVGVGLGVGVGVGAAAGLGLGLGGGVSSDAASSVGSRASSDSRHLDSLTGATLVAEPDSATAAALEKATSGSPARTLVHPLLHSALLACIIALTRNYEVSALRYMLVHFRRRNLLSDLLLAGAEAIGAILCSLDDILFLLQNCITASFVRTSHFNNAFTLDFDGSAELFNFYFSDIASPLSSKLFLTLLNVRPTAACVNKLLQVLMPLLVF